MIPWLLTACCSFSFRVPIALYMSWPVSNNSSRKPSLSISLGSSVMQCCLWICTASIFSVFRPATVRRQLFKCRHSGPIIREVLYSLHVLYWLLHTIQLWRCLKISVGSCSSSRSLSTVHMFFIVLFVYADGSPCCLCVRFPECHDSCWVGSFASLSATCTWLSRRCRVNVHVRTFVVQLQRRLRHWILIGTLRWVDMIKNVADSYPIFE